MGTARVLAISTTNKQYTPRVKSRCVENRCVESRSYYKNKYNFNDDDFLSILDNLIYKEDIDGSQFQNINLLNLAMTRIGKITLSDVTSFNDDPLFLSMLYGMPNVSIETRITA